MDLGHVSRDRLGLSWIDARRFRGRTNLVIENTLLRFARRSSSCSEVHTPKVAPSRASHAVAGVSAGLEGLVAFTTSIRCQEEVGLPNGPDDCPPKNWNQVEPTPAFIGIHRVVAQIGRAARVAAAPPWGQGAPEAVRGRSKADWGHTNRV